MFGFRTDNILPKDGYAGLSINTGKVYDIEKFGKVFIYFDGSSLNLFSVDGATIKIYCHNLWDTRIEEDSFYAPIESISDYNWEEIGENYFLDTDIWNIMSDSLFALLSGK